MAKNDKQIINFIKTLSSKKRGKDEKIVFTVDGTDLVAEVVTQVEWESDDWEETDRLEDCL